MARDKGLEEIIHDELREVHGLSEKAMFGGLVWLVGGNLLCGARVDGMLVRLGKGNDGWALQLAGIVPMMSGNRRMTGWVWADVRAYGNDAVRGRLLDAARRFVLTLPRK